MALNLSQKQEVVAELAEVAAKAHSLIAVEYVGTTVSQMIHLIALNALSIRVGLLEAKLALAD